MKHARRVGIPLALLLALVVAPPMAVAKDKELNYAQKVTEGLRLGEPLVGRLAVLIPLLADAQPGPAGVVAQGDAGVTFSEPEIPSQRYNVAVTNPSDKKALVLAGTVIVGGSRDRMLRHDTILHPNTTVEMRALPASSSSEIRKEPVPFEGGRQIAPVYLRRKGDFGGGSNLIPSFISRNLEFRNEGDERKSLAAIGDSTLLQEYTAENRTKLDAALASMKQQGGVIVGWILALRGRLQSFTIFGDGQVAEGYRGAYLLGATYSAAAIELQAAKKKVPMPGKDNPDKTLEIVMKDAAELLERVQKSKYKLDKTNPDGAAGERHIMQLAGGARGRCVGIDGKLVHMAVYPHDPFSSAFYGSKIEIPDEAITSDEDRIGLAELGRRAESGRRLTGEEKRVLDRVGGRRGGGLGNVGGMGGGPRGGQAGGGGGRRR